MVTVLLDTNIIIDFLRAIPQAGQEVRAHNAKSVSRVTWIEVMVGAAKHEAITRAYLDTLTLVEIDDAIAERAVDIRRRHRIKLPDAVIWATAQVRQLLLVTRNTRDFPAGDPGIRVPYVLP